MEAHDFSKFYEIGGPVIESSIKKLIKEEKITRPNVNINSCIDYLLSVDDVEFKKIYCDLSIFMYSLKQYEYSYALVSNIILIKRCLAISPVSLNYSIIMCMKNPNDLQYINFDYESCKLLYDSGFNICYVFYIACRMNNYESIKFLLNKMSRIDLSTIFTECQIYLKNKLYNILIIDKICEQNDVLIDAIIPLYIGGRKEPCMHLHNLHGMILSCYYFIKYTPQQNSISYVNALNIYYTHKINSTVDTIQIATLKSDKEIYISLFAFHLKPRGGHTKKAVCNL
jgi:hypothetical protein